MTKKDYELIARVIKNEASKWDGSRKGNIRASIVSDIYKAFESELAKENDRFDKTLFLNACSPQ